MSPGIQRSSITHASSNDARQSLRVVAAQARVSTDRGQRLLVHTEEDWAVRKLLAVEALGQRRVPRGILGDHGQRLGPRTDRTAHTWLTRRLKGTGHAARATGARWHH